MAIFILSVFPAFDRPGVNAQTFNYTQYTTRDGLAGEVVHTVVQDKDGFIWFGTETGLSRFDGKQFRNFTTADGLPSNEILGFYIDGQDRMWITTFSKAICYYRQGRIYNQQNDPALRKIKMQGLIKCCGQADNGAIVFWDGENILMLYQDNHVERLNDSIAMRPLFTHFSPDKELMLDGLTWFVMLPEPFRDYARNRRTCYYNQKDRNSVLYFKEDSRMLIVKDGHTLCYDGTEPDLQFMKLQSDSTIWISGYGGGLRLFDFEHKKTLATYFPGYRIYNAIEDREGNNWLVSGGLGVLKLGKQLVAHYNLNKGPASPAAVWIQKKAGKLFAGDDQGNFYRLDEKNTPDGKIATPAIHAVKIKETVYWLRGEMENKLVDYSGSDFFDLVPGQLRSGYKSFFAFKDTVLCAESGGAYLLVGMPWHKLNVFHKDRATRAIRFDDEYFVGTLDGLYIYDRKLQLKAHLLHERISYFAWDDKDLWIATYGSGLYRYRKGLLKPAINEQMGLSSNICTCIFREGKYLWVGTNKGVNKVDVSRQPYEVAGKYSSADGLSSDMINTIYVEDSLVYIGTPKGLDRFIDQPLPERAFCNLKLTDILVSGKPVAPDSQLVLAHKDNSIRFFFSGISFLSAGDMHYEYRLRGLNDLWQTTDEQSLNYLSLPSGKYTLQLRAVNKFGVRSPMLEQSFEIRKALFEQWSFSLLVVLLCSGTIFLLVNLRIKRVQKRENEKQHMNRRVFELEHMALRAQMNPHFIFNCLNSVQNHILRQDTEGANFYLTQFAGLVRQTLDNATRIYITLREEISYISNYLELERMQMGASFQYTINVDPRIAPASVRIPNMVTQPYIENAIKHGLSRLKSGGLLGISYALSQDGQVLECRIWDNGPGIDAVRSRSSGRTHTPKGMSITQERVDMLNKMQGKGQDITVQVTDLGSVKGETGTQVLIRFPMTDA